ncbi:MAG: hypothetical protein NUW23_03315 [Firmicutes bacterium]|nr:hypothetical protein [Bacillota bacterium]
MLVERKWIAAAAAAGIVAALASGFALWVLRGRHLFDTGETRAAVEAAVGRVVTAPAESVRDPGLRMAAAGLDQEPYVAAVWLVDLDGTIVFWSGGPGREGDSVLSLAQLDISRSLDALEPGSMSEIQRLELLTVGALRREGEHNDVFRHMVRRVRGPAGDVVGLIALAYDVNPSVSKPGPGLAWPVLLAAMLVGVGIYWVALPLWVYLDASARGEPRAFWGLFVLFTNLVGLLAYVVATSGPRDRE